MTGSYNFQTMMAVLDCPIRCHFRIKFAALASRRVRLRVVRVGKVSIRASAVNRAIFPPQKHVIRAFRYGIFHRRSTTHI